MNKKQITDVFFQWYSTLLVFYLIFIVYITKKTLWVLYQKKLMGK